MSVSSFEEALAYDDDFAKLPEKLSTAIINHMRRQSDDNYQLVQQLNAAGDELQFNQRELLKARMSLRLTNELKCKFCGSFNKIPSTIFGCVDRVEGECFVCNAKLFWIRTIKQSAPIELTDEQILEVMRPAIYRADGGYIFDTAKDDVIAAGRALLDKVKELNQ